MHDDDAALEGRLLHRLLFFTDAVFAIVLTLLVLELKPPETWREATLETLAHAAPHIGAFVFSFAIIGLFWLAHMNTTRRLGRFDWPTAVANLVFLLPVCMLPYATAWLGANPGGRTAWYLYCTVMIATSAANVGVVLTVYRGGGRLIAGAAEPGEQLYRLVRSAAPGLAFAVGMGLLVAGQDSLSRFCWILIPVFFGLARWVAPGRRRKTPAPPAAEPPAEAA